MVSQGRWVYGVLVGAALLFCCGCPCVTPGASVPGQWTLEYKECSDEDITAFAGIMELKDDGTAELSDWLFTYYGTWEVADSTITISLEEGLLTFTGTVDCSTMQGTADEGATCWSMRKFVYV